MTALYVATHEIATHEIATHEIATHNIATPDIATHNIATHNIATPEIIAQCIKCIKNKLYISYDSDLVIDICAQNGEFIEELSTLARTTLFYDKAPRQSQIRQVDFLTIDFARFDKTFLAGLWYDDIHVVGCPPLDQIEEFINACCKFGKSVSFILPQTKSIVYFPPNFQLLHEEKFDNIPYVFQIWIKTDL